MVFNSFLFCVFFALALAVHNLPIRWTFKKVNLVIASSLFYAAWNPMFLALLWISIVTDYLVAARIAAATSVARRRLLLGVSLSVNLGMLAFFKYGGFLLQNVRSVAALVGWSVATPRFDILLPVGISFYTFETISYTIDVYRRREQPWRSFLDFAVFLTFFPHLVAGPIVRPSDFLPQCQRERRATRDQLAWGLVLLVIGLFEKVVVADGILAPIADRVFGAAGHLRLRDGWGGCLAFSGQIFCDFAGYSLCAIGVALCFGFELPDNFMSPYAAKGFSDFWRRWHVSLSSWLRDYLYIPLGGNRHGPTRTQVNLALTMLLGGLWHGASWTFVVWGGLHGLYLVGERVVRKVVASPAPSALFDALAASVTFVLVCFAWVFFRAPSVAGALHIAQAMVMGSRADAVVALGKTDAIWVVVTISAMLILQRVTRDRSLGELYAAVPRPVRGLILTAMVVAIFTENGGGRAFIYFQF